MARVSFSDAIGIAGIVLAIVLFVLDKAGKLKGPWLYYLLALAGAMTLFVAIGNSWVLDAPEKWKIWRGVLLGCAVALCYSGAAIWVSDGSSRLRGKQSDEETSSLPSLLFVFGAPLGDNESSTWLMMVKHYGPATAYNCTIDFYDDDRKNIEHEWLVKHPNTPVLPHGMFDPSHITVHIAEGGPEGTFNNFQWKPLDPNRQHYTVSISCRDGYFVEKWEVTRVDGVLRSKIVIEHGPQWIQNNPGKNHLVFRYQDPEFIRTDLLTAIPAKRGKEVHPGWKPNYKFAVPVAIIDPNGNVQVMAGAKQPDGSTATDFGSWNLLTKHFGDRVAQPPQ